MLRNLGVGRLVGLMLLGVCGASGSWLRAQDASSLDRGIAPATNQNDGGDQPRERVGRGSLTRPDLRADAVDDAGQPVDPQIEALLQEWSTRTKEIKKVSGTHLRATRDFAFGTESWAEGRFYVETPDKGRIDVQPYSGKMPGKALPRTAPNGRTVALSIQPDSKHDRWICDGKEIKVIDDDHKTYDAVKIPPNQRGENIMDGPLPFLLGMPPAKAKARYRFKLLAQNERAYKIEVEPKWKQDAVDWSQAWLILDRETCLPAEVHLTNAARTSETVYIFKKLQINQIRILFWTDPFNPSLAFYGYKRSVHNVAAANPDATQLGPGQMPSFVGMPYQTVVKNLKALGYKNVKLMRGDPATSPEQTYHVEKQRPQAFTKLEPESEIVLIVYDQMPETGRYPPRTVNKPQEDQ
jgi:TIGR03009 family protein